MFTVQTRTLLQQPMSDRRLAQPPPIFMSTTGLLDGFNLSLGCEKKLLYSVAGYGFYGPPPRCNIVERYIKCKRRQTEDYQ